MKICYRDHMKAFEDAINKGTLSREKGDNYAGDYMYMYSDDEKDYFKHIDTREYISVVHGMDVSELEKVEVWI